MRNIDFRNLIRDCWLDLLCGIGASLCLLFFDGRLVMFFVTLILMAAITLGLSIYRSKKLESMKKENEDYLKLERLCLILEKHENIDDAIKEIEAFDGMADISNFLKGENSELDLTVKANDMLNKITEAYKEKNKEAISIYIKEIANMKNSNENSIWSVSSRRNNGLLMCILVSLPLLYFPYVNVVFNAVNNHNWLGLFIRLATVLIFMCVEFFGSSFKSKLIGGKSV